MQNAAAMKHPSASVNVAVSPAYSPDRDKRKSPTFSWCFSITSSRSVVYGTSSRVNPPRRSKSVVRIVCTLPDSAYWDAGNRGPYAESDVCSLSRATFQLSGTLPILLATRRSPFVPCFQRCEASENLYSLRLWSSNRCRASASDAATRSSATLNCVAKSGS